MLLLCDVDRELRTTVPSMWDDHKPTARKQCSTSRSVHAPSGLATKAYAILFMHPTPAGMAELADAADSKSADPCGHGGSTPLPAPDKIHFICGLDKQRKLTVWPRTLDYAQTMPKLE